MLEEHQILLCSQETDLDVQEAILAEELACGLHPPDGRDLTAELEEIHVCMDGINEAGRLSKLAMEISHSFVDLGMLPVQDIPQLPMSAQEVLAATGLVLEAPVPGTELGPSTVPVASGCSPRRFSVPSFFCPPKRL
jgi:hypothetical protein